MSHKIGKLLKKKRKPILLFLGILFGIAGLVFYAEEASQGASSGLNFCLHVLIPSTFPFLVLASLCVHSGVSLWLERLLRPVTQLLFHLPGCCGATILLGMVGGYPVGARGIAALYRQGSVTREQANRMLSFCVNAGPSFTISVIGSSLYGRPLFGVYLFASLTAASLLIGVGLGVFSRLTAKESIASPSASPETAPMPFGDALVVSASDASRGMVGACSFVLLFSSALALLQSVGFLPLLSQALSALGVSPASAEAGFPLLWEIGGGCGGSFPAGHLSDIGSIWSWIRRAVRPVSSVGIRRRYWTLPVEIFSLPSMPRSAFLWFFCYSSVDVSHGLAGSGGFCVSQHLPNAARRTVRSQRPSSASHFCWRCADRPMYRADFIQLKAKRFPSQIRIAFDRKT